MPPILYVPAFLAGCVLLYAGAHWLVRGAATVAEIMGIPKSVVGLTLVALGTSAPEMVVNFLAALNGHTEFALSNVSGSNLANLCVGFGLCALFGPVLVRRREFYLDSFFLFLTPLLVLSLFYVGGDKLPLAGALPLTIVLAVYLLTLLGRTGFSEVDETVKRSGFTGPALFLLGAVCLYAGGELILRASLEAAKLLNVSEAIVGLTIVAAGTSIPDIAASVIACRRGEYAIAVGNLVGSNISNIVVVLNGTILVSQGSLPTTRQINGDYAMVLLASFLFWAVGTYKECLPRWMALGMLAGYALYLILRILQ